MIAITQGHSKMIKKLIELGAKIDKSSFTNIGPLSRSVQEGMIKVARRLIQLGADLDRQGNRSGNAPLHMAVSEGHDEIVRLLIESGARVDIKNKNLRTPLHVASENGRFEIIQDLLRFDACSTTKDAFGYDPMEYALKKKSEIITKVIMFKRHSY